MLVDDTCRFANTTHTLNSKQQISGRYWSNFSNPSIVAPTHTTYGNLFDHLHAFYHNYLHKQYSTLFVWTYNFKIMPILASIMSLLCQYQSMYWRCVNFTVKQKQTNQNQCPRVKKTGHGLKIASNGYKYMVLSSNKYRKYQLSSVLLEFGVSFV